MGQPERKSKFTLRGEMGGQLDLRGKSEDRREITVIDLF